MTKKTEEAVTYNPTERPQRQVTMNLVWLAPLAVIILCGLSFWIGTAYEKGHVKTTASATSAASRFGQAGGFGGRFNNGQRPNIGTVTAVSSDSITIQDERDNSTKTYSITSSTTFTNDGASAAVTDIQTGDRVLIQTSSTTSTTATSIAINPSFGGGMAGQQQGSSTSTAN